MSDVSGPRMTLPTQAVLRALLARPADEMYGLQICAEAGLPSGTVHPILARLEGLDWVTSRWEQAEPASEGRPRRRYYALTKDGAEQARTALALATQRAATLRLRANPVPDTT